MLWFVSIFSHSFFLLQFHRHSDWILLCAFYDYFHFYASLLVFAHACEWWWRWQWWWIQQKEGKLLKRQQLELKITKSNYNRIESCKLNVIVDFK